MTVEWRKVVVPAEENYTSYYVVQYGIYAILPFVVPNGGELYVWGKANCGN